MEGGPQGMRFELLGPLRALRGAEQVPLGPPRQQSVLAVLLLQEGRSISYDALVEAVWGAHPPTHVRNLVQKYISGIRRALTTDTFGVSGDASTSDTPASSASDTPAVSVTSLTSPTPVDTSRNSSPAPTGGPAALELLWTGSGYRLTGALISDLQQRRSLIHEAVRARDAGDLRRSDALAQEAEELWRGDFAEGLTGPYLEAERRRWAEKRLMVLEARLEGKLALGHYHECVHELVRQVAAHPLRERLTWLLMMALYRSGLRGAAGVRGHPAADRRGDRRRPGPVTAAAAPAHAAPGPRTAAGPGAGFLIRAGLHGSRNFH